ncbi:MAG: ATP-dependent Clp protease proteolytic subunit [Planctomycetota bacterium]|nr:ATP-dependent Clp protease proteolytic subunit [Planctomycetota bacterium]
MFCGAHAVEAAPGAAGTTLPSPVPEADADGAFGESWADRVVAIPVKGVIVGKPFSEMPETIERALDKADADGAHLIILEIDSPGGEVGVCDTLSKRIFESKTPVVSLVLHKAVSGGAMLASAAREIVMTRAARMGDIQPMQTSLTGSAPGMDDRTAEKIEVDIRTIMKVYAEHRDRPAAVMEAMVSRASSLYRVEFAGAPAEYLTGHELELLEKNIEIGRDKRRITDTRIIKPEGKLLELSAQEAVEYGIASEVVESADAFYAARGIEPGDIVRPEIQEGSLDLKKLIPKIDDLGLPVWVIVLLGVFLVVAVAGFVTEYHAPGSGIPAAIGIIGLVCFFSTLLMHDRGSPLGIAIFLIGITLLVVEIMILPGFGVAGILGILGILAGLLLAFTPDWDSEYMHQFMWEEVGTLTLIVFVGLVAALAVILIIAKYGENIPYIGAFFLTDSQPSGVNPHPETMEREPHESARLRAASLKGRRGVAETMLRPSGKVRLDSGELLDVVTDGVYVEAGKRVVVADAAANRIVVEVDKQTGKQENA